MAGLTIDGLKARILVQNYTLTEAEAIDLFFLYPTLVSIEWVKGNVKTVIVSGLNLEFKMRK